MENMNPHPLTDAEWSEILAIPAVREAWGLDAAITPEEFANRVYGARFDFHAGGPGYVGDLYVLQGDARVDDRPIALWRENGILVTGEH
jgi:hypothetical protein